MVPILIHIAQELDLLNLGAAYRGMNTELSTHAKILQKLVGAKGH